jgi:hypothetical protein
MALPAPSCLSEGAGRNRKIDSGLWLKRKLGREERYRTVISGMEPRRIAVVMLLPRTGSKTLSLKIRCEQRGTKLCHALLNCQDDAAFLSCPRQNDRDVVGLFLISDPRIDCGGYDLTDLGERKMPVFAD